MELEWLKSQTSCQARRQCGFFRERAIKRCFLYQILISALEISYHLKHFAFASCFCCLLRFAYKDDKQILR